MRIKVEELKKKIEEKEKRIEKRIGENIHRCRRRGGRGGNREAGK